MAEVAGTCSSMAALPKSRVAQHYGLRVADLVWPARVRRAPLAGGVFPRALPAQAGRTDAQRGETRRGVTDQSSSVEMSPGFCPSSLAFNTRRMILPERVLGSEGTISIS